MFTPHAGTDTIVGFDVTQDKLNLKDLLVGYNAGQMANFVRLSTSGANTLVEVNVDGSGTDFMPTIVLLGVNLTIGDLGTHGALILA